MRSLVFAEPVNPLRLDQPTVLTVDTLLREVIAALSDDRDEDGLPAHANPPKLDPRQRQNLERVALDRLCEAEELPLDLPQPADDRLRTVAGILLDNPADPRTSAELGACAGASERTVSRLFRAETGLTFPQWRARLRLQHALALLAAGEPVTAVAMACGFSTPSAFIGTFRSALGTTPGRYQHEVLSEGAVHSAYREPGHLEVEART